MNLEDEMLQRITDRREAKRRMSDAATEVSGSDDLKQLKGQKQRTVKQK